ncbi:MAG: hypothetical protein JO210_03560 [Acidobacteriaceae bacterium]|nr:hypothetical protein [Acidobacteriaceae bacterium]
MPWSAIRLETASPAAVSKCLLALMPGSNVFGIGVLQSFMGALIEGF